MTHEVLSQREIQAAQLLVGIATAVFIGRRFLPPRYRHGVGIVLTVGYLTGVAAFAIYALVR